MKRKLLTISMAFYGIAASAIIAFAAVSTTEVDIVEFGNFLSTGTPGIVQLQSTPIYTNVIGIGGANQGRLTCNITHPTSSAAITGPASATITHTTQPGNTMSVVPIADNASHQISCTSASPTIKWKSTLTVGANQAAGEYTGTFSATVNPNKGGPSSTYVGNMHAHIYTPLAVSEANLIDFGTFAPSPSTSGTITINPSTGAVSTTNVEVLTPGTRGQYNVTGLVGQSFNYTMSPQNVSLSNGSSTMNLDLGTGGTGSLNGSGIGSFYLGGTLTVNASQAAGNYSGTFAVNIDYS